LKLCIYIYLLIIHAHLTVESFNFSQYKFMKSTQHTFSTQLFTRCLHEVFYNINLFMTFHVDWILDVYRRWSIDITTRYSSIVYDSRSW